MFAAGGLPSDRKVGCVFPHCMLLSSQIADMVCLIGGRTLLYLYTFVDQELLNYTIRKSTRGLKKLCKLNK